MVNGSSNLSWYMGRASRGSGRNHRLPWGKDMLPSLAPTRHKNSGDNERSFFVDKEAVDVRTVKRFYFFIFQPELVVVLNMKKWNGREKHGLLHSCLVGTKKIGVQRSFQFARVLSCLVNHMIGLIIGFQLLPYKKCQRKKIHFLTPIRWPQPPVVLLQGKWLPRA